MLIKLPQFGNLKPSTNKGVQSKKKNPKFYGCGAAWSHAKPK
jgi:hypothetical protein